MPVSADGVHLNAPFYEGKIKLSECFSKINPKALVFGGGFKKDVK